MKNSIFDFSEIMLAAKDAGASRVIFTPEGSIEVLLDPSPRRSPRNAGGVHEVHKQQADGTVVTYWYAYRGGPRISEEEARRICDAARNKVVPIHPYGD